MLIWSGVALAVTIPVVAAAASPLLAWREPMYIVAGFAGVVGLALMLFQPLLAGGYLPGLAVKRARQIHRFVGALLVIAVAVHVGGLWITSPPDVVDALLFASPTPFSAWGVIAMWAVLATALLAVLRRRLQLSPHVWRRAHMVFFGIIVVGTVVHALLIEGTMETASKIALCFLVLVVTIMAVHARRSWAPRRRRNL